MKNYNNQVSLILVLLAGIVFMTVWCYHKHQENLKLKKEEHVQNNYF